MGQGGVFLRYGEEVHRHPDRFRASRPAQADLVGQGGSAALDPRANPIEGRPRPARPAHCRRGRGRPCHHRTGPTALCRGGFGGLARPASARQPAGAQDRWRGRSPSDRACLQRPAGGSRPLALALAGRQACRAGVPFGRLPRDGPPGLKANELTPWRKQEWVIPPEANAEFVYHMEDVLDIYTRPADPKRPLVCLDEMPKKLIGEVRSPEPAEPGRPERFDYEYVRNGVANIFCLCEPLLGTRELTVTDHRPREDWCRLI